MKIPSTELGDNQIEAILEAAEKSENPEASIETVFFQLQSQQLLKEFLVKLNTLFINRVSGKMTNILINVIYSNADKFSKVGRGIMHFYDSEYDKARFLLEELLNKGIDKSQIQTKLEEIISNTPDLYFAVRVVDDCDKRSRRMLDNIYSSVNFTDLHKSLTERLKEYFIYAERDIFAAFDVDYDWGYILAQWGTNWDSYDSDNHLYVNFYVLSLVRNDVKKFVKFLSRQRREHFGNFVWDFEQFAKVYDINEFEELAKSFINDKSLTRNEKEIIETFLEAITTRNQTEIVIEEEEV